MTGTDLLADAIAELYSTDPEEFVQRRGVLVSRAREAGQAPVARRIAGLRKPTRSAWVVNQLVRSAPDVISDLSQLGAELRAAQQSLDGEAIRQLSLRRRQLIEDLVRQALELSGQRSPPVGLRDEVTATLSAAVADPEVAAKLGSGTLERAAHHEGFGPAGPPVLTLVPPLADDESARGKRAGDKRAARPGSRVRPGSAAAGGPAERDEAAVDAATQAERAIQERERRLATAQREAAEADGAADAATTAEQQQEAAVRQLEQQLAQARLDLADVRQQARRARAGQRRARAALERLRQ